MAFSYDVLPNEHIRLLEVLDPYGQHQDGEMRFKVHPVPISQCPPYTAISYVWGLGAASRKLYLDQRSIAIRANLWECLHYVCQHYRNTVSQGASTWNHIWVDAICINQADANERSRQVQMMDRIFRNAVEMSAWLGPQQSPTFLQWREDAVTRIEHDGWWLKDHLFEIAQRPYWTRMWIVQEFRLAKNIRFFVGSASFDSFHMNNVVRQLGLSLPCHEELQHILKHTKARDIDAPPHQTLYELLLMSMSCQCQDPKDKVFALLSLVNPRERASLQRFFPDYSLTHDAIVIITLSHLQDYSLMAITADSKDLFDSLGVVPLRSARQRLLAISEGFDYRRGADQWPDLVIVPYCLRVHGDQEHLSERNNARRISGILAKVGLCSLPVVAVLLAATIYGPMNTAYFPWRKKLRR